MNREDIIKSIMENCPEGSLSLDCISWKYADCVFKFRDLEDGKVYVLDIPKLLIGFDNMITAMTRFEYPGDNASDEVMNDWLCCQDAETVDCLIQFSIFGEVIYG